MEESRVSAFDTNAFLKFLFSVVFLFFCCLVLMLYLSKCAGWIVTFIMRYMVLPRQTIFRIGGFHISLLQARIFFQDVYYLNENFSLRIVDGYYTFAYWGTWLGHPNWTRVHDYMLSDSLIGTRCLVLINLKYNKGTIVAVDSEKRKLAVKLDAGPSATSLDDGDDEDDDTTVATSRTPPVDEREMEPVYNTVTTSSLQGGNVLGLEADGVSHDGPFIHGQSHTGRGAGAGGTCTVNVGEDTADELIKTFDMREVHIRSKPGRCQLHINGMRFCLFNATGRYNELAVDPETAAQKLREDRERRANVRVKETRRLFSKCRQMLKGPDNPLDLDADENTGGDFGDSVARGGSGTASGANVEEAKLLQDHQLQYKSSMQRLFAFIGAVELEFFASMIDIGGADSAHPYFLHMGFQKGEGRVFLTRDGCQPIDLYRIVTELTLQQTDIRMAQMDIKHTEHQMVHNPSLRDRAHLVFSGATRKNFTHENDYVAHTEPSDLIRDFGVVMDAHDEGTVHIVFYRDVANVYAGEEVVRDKLPKTGVEILVDAPTLRYGPWLEYCRTQLWLFFQPPNYRPLLRHECVIGEPRPNAGFDFFAQFVRETRIVVPFKRRAPAPSPPFGIKDSNRVGTITATIGAGSQFIQPGFFMMDGERKQNYQALFMARNAHVMTNCVLDCDTIFCTAKSVQFFFDRQDDLIWNGRKLWNFMPKVSGGEVFFYMCHVDFFLDLLNDWQFAAHTYHNVPLSTEMFNTLERCVQDFIPNVKRFEAFIDGTFTFNINANNNNVVFSDDPNDRTRNTFGILKVQTANFSVILPSDQYQLSYENEVVRAIEVSAQGISAHMSLPITHPLFGQAREDEPWATSDSAEVHGRFVSIVPKQSAPLPRDNMNPATGRTRLHNYFNLDIEFINLHGRLMGPHITLLLNTFHNIFLDHMLTIRPDELYWLLAKLQSNATTGMNKRKELKQYIESAEPAGNDLELCVTVRLANVNAIACIGPAAEDLGLNLTTGLVSFTYVKQFAVTDTAIVLAPITARFLDRDGSPMTARDAPYLCVGDICVGMVKHFGRMPLKPKIHDSIDVRVGGVSFEMSIEHIVQLILIATTLIGHLKAEDPVMEAEVEAARSVAELAAERIVKEPARRLASRRSDTKRQSSQPPPVYTAHHTATNGGLRSPASSALAIDTQGTRAGQTAENPNMQRRPEDWPEGERTGNKVLMSPDGSPSSPLSPDVQSQGAVAPAKPRRKKNVLFRIGGFSDEDENDDDAFSAAAAPPMGFADEVPYNVAAGFARFMDQCNSAEDDSKDYGLFFTLVNVGPITGAVRVREEGYMSLDFPQGISVAESTLNDGNSNKRTSAAVKQLALRALIKKGPEVPGRGPAPAVHHVDVESEYVEVFSLQTSLCVRQYTAYPFDGSLESHLVKQRQFVKENDYEGLICFQYDPAGCEGMTNPEGGSGAHNEEVLSPTAPEMSSSTHDAPATQPRMHPRSRATPEPTPFSVHRMLVESPGDSGTFFVINGSDANGALSGSTLPDSLNTSMRVEEMLNLHDGGVQLRSDSRGQPKDTEFSKSHDTTTHVRNGHGGNELGGDREEDLLSFLGSQTASGNDITLDSLETVLDGRNGRSDIFATCLSASWGDEASYFDSFDKYAATESVSSSSLPGVDSSRVERVQDGRRSSTLDRQPSGTFLSSADGKYQTRVPPASDTNAAAAASASELYHSHRFYRTYFRVRRGSEGTTVLDHTLFTSGAPRGSAGYRTHFTAPLPPPAFVLHHVPTTTGDGGGTSAEEALLADLYRDAEDSGDDDGQNFAWAMRPADNRERSKMGSTTKHIHAEAVDKVRMVLTKEAVLLGAAAAGVLGEVVAAIVNTNKRDLVDPSVCEAQFGFPGTIPIVATDATRAARGQAARLFRKEKEGGKSRVRVQQKRWLWEDHIISAIVPSVDLRVLVPLPIPEENRSSLGSMTEGMYSATLSVRELQLVVNQNQPPTNVEALAQDTTKLCVSFRMATLALVGQIEQEPLLREGNLSIVVPSVLYDESKPTIAVAYLTQLRVRGKRDTVRGTEGGACGVWLDTVEVCLMRDFFDHLCTLRMLVTDVHSIVLGRTQALHSLSLSAFTGGAASPTTSTNASPLQLRPNVGSRPGTTFIAFSGFERGRTIQGKGHVERVIVSFVDSRNNERDAVLVDLNTVSLVEVTRTSANFFLVIPQRGRDRNVQLQFVGEVDGTKVRVYPSLLHATRTHPPATTTHGAQLLSRQASMYLQQPTNSSLHASLESHSQHTAAGFADRGSTVRVRGMNMIYNGTFTMRTVDASVMHSEMNYAQLKGRGLTGCAESRSEKVSSRECVQMEVLTEAISERLKARLRFKAHTAREHAKRSRYAAPATTTEQLQLYSTASFFAEQLLVHYIADALITSAPSRDSDAAALGNYRGGGGGARSRLAPKDAATLRKRESQVVVAVIDDVALAAQFTEQFNMDGDQVNVQLKVSKILVHIPYRPQALETVHPQAHQFIDTWRRALRTLQGSVKRRGSTASDAVPLTPASQQPMRSLSVTVPPESCTTPTSAHVATAAGRHKASMISVQACNIEAVIGLPQDVRQKVMLPEVSAFVQLSSNGRRSVKMHAHPFTITCRSPFPERYNITFPDVYCMIAQDTIKMTSSIMLDTITITITPLFINHILSSYERISGELVSIFSKQAPINDEPSASGTEGSPLSSNASWNKSHFASRNSHHERFNPNSAGSPLTVTSPASPYSPASTTVPARSGRRRSVLFLLKGVRFSYLTSITNLRLSIKSLNATADTAETQSHKKLDWVVNIINAQVALVDRDDHDQMTAMVSSMTHTQRSAAVASPSPSSTKPHVVVSAPAATKAAQVRSRHLSSGFIWGSLELSLTIASGKTARNEASESLTNTSFNAYSREMQKALLDKLGHSSSQWRMNVYSPLVILRFGLDALLKECVDETHSDIGHMRRAVKKENQMFEVRLQRHKRFHKLQEEKRRYETLLRRAEKDQQEKLRRMTEQVAYDVSQRRGGIAVDSDAIKMLSFYFSLTTEHIVNAIISDFMVVIPFGDAAYRSLLEELPGAYSCGKVERHVHTRGCLRRQQFIPTLAIKTRVDDITFIGDVKSVQYLISSNAAPSSAGSRGASTAMSGTRNTARQYSGPSVIPKISALSKSYTHLTKVCGKLVASHTHACFTDGSPVDMNTDIVDLLNATRIIGGQGTLTNYSLEERNRSHNTIFVRSADCTFRVEQKENDITVGVGLELSGPQVQLSTRSVSIISELCNELTAEDLHSQLHPFPSADSVAHVDPSPTSAVTQAASDWAEQGWGDEASNEHSTSQQAGAPPAPRLHIDVIGRLEDGTASMYSYATPEDAQQVGRTADTRYSHAYSTRGSSSITSSRAAKTVPGGQQRRTVGFATGQDSRAGATSPTSAAATKVGKSTAPSGGLSFQLPAETTACILTVPLPAVAARLKSVRPADPNVEDTTTVRVDVFAGEIRLSPSITALAREIEECAAVYVQNQQERMRYILTMAQGAERQVATLSVPLHCPLIDVLLPLPRAYAAALSQQRMHDIIRTHRRAPHRSAAVGALRSGGAATALAEVSGLQTPSFVALHVSLKTFRLVFTTDPFASTAFTIFLDESGSVDVLGQQHKHPGTEDAVVTRFPKNTVIVHASQLRVECQTKLEVKSLEVFLPEVQVVVSGRGGSRGDVTSIAVNFLFNGKGTDPNSVIRMQHLSQCFTVFQLWIGTLGDTLKSVQNLFTNGAQVKQAAQNIGRTQLARRMRWNSATQKTGTAAAARHDQRLMIVVYVTRGLCQVDMGSGSGHQLLFGSGRFAIENTAKADGGATYLLVCHLSHVAIRSEGVLSGTAGLTDVMLKGFLIHNAHGAEVFMRSPGGRTFRQALMVEKVYASFKERQLKDIFECKVGTLHESAMDGVGEEEFATVRLDVSLAKGTLGVTPSTAPAFLTFVRGISTIVADQKHVAMEKLKDRINIRKTFSTLSHRIRHPHAQSVSSAEPRRPFSSPLQSREISIALPPAPEPTNTAADFISSDQPRREPGSATTTKSGAAVPIPFMGNTLMRVPCGQLSLTIDETTLLLGAISSGEAATGCVVASFPHLHLSFAECPCDQYTAIKKVLVVETHNMELYRPGSPRVVIMGFRGTNNLHFYTRQVLGEKTVAFALVLDQTHPWTGNPRFDDFKEMITLVYSFTDKRNAAVFQKFGKFEADSGSTAASDYNFRTYTSSLATPIASHESPSHQERSSTPLFTTPSRALQQPSYKDLIEERVVLEDSDPRELKPIRATKFSPQLRFGGDVSVNTEVILNWLGIAEKKLPNVINSRLCDALEEVIASIAEAASERERDKDSDGPKSA